MSNLQKTFECSRADEKRVVGYFAITGHIEVKGGIEKQPGTYLSVPVDGRTVTGSDGEKNKF